MSYGPVDRALGISVLDEVEVKKGEFRGKTCRIHQIYHSRGKPKYWFECYMYDPFFGKRILKKYVKNEIRLLKRGTR